MGLFKRMKNADKTRDSLDCILEVGSNFDWVTPLFALAQGAAGWKHLSVPLPPDKRTAHVLDVFRRHFVHFKRGTVSEKFSRGIWWTVVVVKNRQDAMRALNREWPGMFG